MLKIVNMLTFAKCYLNVDKTSRYVSFNFCSYILMQYINYIIMKTSEYIRSATSFEECHKVFLKDSKLMFSITEPITLNMML